MAPCFIYRCGYLSQLDAADTDAFLQFSLNESEQRLARSLRARSTTPRGREPSPGSQSPGSSGLAEDPLQVRTRTTTSIKCNNRTLHAFPAVLTIPRLPSPPKASVKRIIAKTTDEQKTLTFIPL